MDQTTLRVLLIGCDVSGDALCQLEHHRTLQLESARGKPFAETLQRLALGAIDAVVLDLPRSMVGPRWEELARLRRDYPTIPVVVLTDPEDVELATEALRQGAADCLLKGQDGVLFERVMRYAVEHQHAQQALKQSERRYRRLLSAVTSYLYQVELKDGQSVSTKHGPGCLATTGYSPKDYAADPFLWLRMVHDRDRARVQRYVQRVLGGKNASPIEHRIYRKDGTVRWIRNTIVPQYDAAGRLVHYDGIVEDITQRKRAERSLRHRQAQLLAAQRIQQQLLPDAPPSLPGYDIAAGLYPAEIVAGDLYDFLPLPDGFLGLVVGDVSGHGFGPAIYMALTHAILRSLALVHNDPAEILERANAALVKETREERFVSLLLARLEPQSGTLVYAGAGHPAGLVLNASGELKACLRSVSLPLGVSSTASFCTSEPLFLAPGDVVLFITDGVVEAAPPGSEMFGAERTLNVARSRQSAPAKALVAHLHHEVLAFCQRRTPADDITVLVVKRRLPDA